MTSRIFFCSSLFSSQLSQVPPPHIHNQTNSMDKRKDPPTSEGVLIKRQKPEENTPSNAVTIQTKGSSGALIQTVMTRNEEATNQP
jgi:hypothetical protein